MASLREQLSLAQEERDAQQADAQSRTQAYQGLQEMVAGLEKQLADSQRRKVAAENRFAAEEACRKAAEDRCAGAEKRHVQDEELAESLAAALHEAKQSPHVNGSQSRSCRGPSLCGGACCTPKGGILAEGPAEGKSRA